MAELDRLLEVHSRYGEFLTSLFPPDRHSHIISRVNQKLRTPDKDLTKWLMRYEKLPLIKPSKINLAGEEIYVGDDSDVDDEMREALKVLLESFCPWRQGPFKFFGIDIDSEWRSFLKWNRLKSHVKSLVENKIILDVGAANGYYSWRMLGAGAKAVVGVDPSLYHFSQFLIMQKYIQASNVTILPLKFEEILMGHQQFDTVFSMGVIYHQRDHLSHLSQLKSYIKPQGKLVLEALVIDGKEGDVLIPDTYAKMHNVYAVPSVLTLESWIKKAGFSDINVIDIHQTASDEQRTTSWMRFESLKDFLNPSNSNQTIEGHPAPQRALIIAQVS